jgi:hypothetical protein
VARVAADGKRSSLRVRNWSWWASSTPSPSTRGSTATRRSTHAGEWDRPPTRIRGGRPYPASDALEAKAAAERAFTACGFGLGAVARLVGGVGIANVTVIT